MRFEKVSISKFFSVIKDQKLREKEMCNISLSQTEDDDEVIFHYCDPKNGELVAIYHDIGGVEEGDYYIVISP